jgi:hypothetical protein
MLMRMPWANSIQTGPADMVNTSIWTFGHSTSTIRLTLKNAVWQQMFYTLARKPAPLAVFLEIDTRRCMKMLGKSDGTWDLTELAWMSMMPAHRLTDLQWREHGLLLPFGVDDRHFRISNP